ncbi:MAG: N-6 DNA methylase, partial [Afipia sp.]|nr:N-6 DNA methylase [Afipia sp.]
MTVSASAAPRFTKRYRQVTEAKAGGSTYTPKLLADFVAQQIVVAADTIVTKKSIRILDPAAGDGELLVSLVRELSPDQDIELHAFDVHESALLVAEQRVLEIKPRAKFVRHHRDFLQHVTENYDSPSLFSKTGLGQPYDLIIANPPYVRTQIMGAEIARALAQKFGLEGRVDLYHAFLIALSRVLSPNGVAGIIVSNRFMTTRAGSSVRAAIHEGFNLLHVWDLGDTKLFEAAVLPAVLLLSGKDGETNFPSEIRFTSIYETSAQEEHESENPIAALAHEGVVRIADERCFEVLHGCLASQRGDVWRLSSEKSDNWLET